MIPLWSPTLKRPNFDFFGKKQKNKKDNSRKVVYASKW